MELSKLEAKFFTGILNAELGVPVSCNIEIRQGTILEMIVVPEIAPEGYFRLKYFNASPYKPEPQVGDDGIPYYNFIGNEGFGSTSPVGRGVAKACSGRTATKAISNTATTSAPYTGSQSALRGCRFPG